MSHLENIYIFGILASSWLIWLIWKWHSSTFNFWPLITLWGNFDAPYLKLLNDASVASACSYVRTCRRVRNSKKIATIRDFHLPGSFLCLSTRLFNCWTCRPKVLRIEHGSNLKTFLMNGSITSIILRSLSSWHNAFLVLNECTFPSLSSALYNSL